MPAWAIFILWKVVLPDVIIWLRSKGYINAAEGLAATGVVDIINEVKSLKTYPEYPDDPKPPSNVNNLSNGQ